MDKNEQQFIIGFNSGYLLAKFDPSIISKVIKKLEPKTNYIQGLLLGQSEFEQSLTSDRLKELGNTKNRTLGRDLTIE